LVVARTSGIFAFVVGSFALLWYSFQKGAPFGWVEAVGFITGALCVWLTVFENIWNFPIGIANSVFLGVLFLGQKLFADAGLQLMFIALGFQGWYLWLYGGTQRTELPIVKARASDLWLSAGLLAVGLPILWVHLRNIQDSAPFLDALITVLSIVAQILLNRKRLENWFVWMTVDVISIGLYVFKHLYLTAMLYALFFAMCVMGFEHWRRQLATSKVAVA